MFSNLLIKTDNNGDVDWCLSNVRGSQGRCSIKKSVLKSFAKFTGKLLSLSLFCNKIAGLKSPSLLRKRRRHICFLVNFYKNFKNTFFIEKLRATANSAVFLVHLKPISVCLYLLLTLNKFRFLFYRLLLLWTWFLARGNCFSHRNKLHGHNLSCLFISYLD